MFVWRSNLLGSSGKGTNTSSSTCSAPATASRAGPRKRTPNPAKWSGTTAPAKAKLDLLVTLDFRMSTTCLYSDIVLPTATWYEKNDLNTSDMHPFIHPLSAAVDLPGSRAATGRSVGLSPRSSARSCRPPRRRGTGADADDARQPGRTRPQAIDVKDWKRASAS